MPSVKEQNTFMDNAEKIIVEVAYALPDKQRIVEVEVLVGTTAREAARLSAIDTMFEGIDIDTVDMGVFGKSVKPDSYIMQAGQRVEIYRPLLIDPKEVRKNRAAKLAKEKQAT